MRILLALPALLLVAPALAADPDRFAPVPEPPAPVPGYQRPAAAEAPPADAADEVIPEPEVVITTKGEDRHEEYRIGGRLYMIKVIPKRGAPYYLIDREGQGEFVKSDLLPDVRPPMWVIKRF